jgi:putative PIN family toxin of toxin-antitoxin system
VKSENSADDQMLRVVLDTNVLVSAIISDGKPRDLFRKGIKNQFIIVSSDLMLKELTRVLRRPKFRTSQSEIRRITLALINSAEVVNVKSKLKVVEEDSEDNIVIETAYDGHADLIVTGDSHLLELENYEEIKIVTVEKALKSL